MSRKPSVSLNSSHGTQFTVEKQQRRIVNVFRIPFTLILTELKDYSQEDHTLLYYPILVIE